MPHQGQRLGRMAQRLSGDDEGTAANFRGISMGGPDKLSLGEHFPRLKDRKLVH